MQTHMRATWYKNNFLNKTDEIIKPFIKKKKNYRAFYSNEKLEDEGMH